MTLFPLHRVAARGTRRKRTDDRGKIRIVLFLGHPLPVGPIQAASVPKSVWAARGVPKDVADCAYLLGHRRVDDRNVLGGNRLRPVIVGHALFMFQLLARLDIELVYLSFPLGSGLERVRLPKVQVLTVVPKLDLCRTRTVGHWGYGNLRRPGCCWGSC